MQIGPIEMFGLNYHSVTFVLRLFVCGVCKYSYSHQFAPKTTIRPLGSVVVVVMMLPESNVKFVRGFKTLERNSLFLQSD